MKAKPYKWASGDCCKKHDDHSNEMGTGQAPFSGTGVGTLLGLTVGTQVRQLRVNGTFLFGLVFQGIINGFAQFSGPGFPGIFRVALNEIDVVLI